MEACICLFTICLLCLSNQVTCLKAGYTQKMFCSTENFFSGTWIWLELENFKWYSS